MLPWIKRLGTRRYWYPIHDLYNTHADLMNLSSSTHIPNSRAIRPAVPETRKRGTHLRTCRCTPSLVCAHCLANWSLTIYQISAQYVQSFPRNGKGVRTCARADTPHPECRVLTLNPDSLFEMLQIQYNSQLGDGHHINTKFSTPYVPWHQSRAGSSKKIVSEEDDARWSLNILQFCSCQHEYHWIADTQSPQFMMRQTTTKAPEPPRESCTAQGTTRRGLHASRLGSSGHRSKASVFDDRPCNKKEL